MDTFQKLVGFVGEERRAGKQPQISFCFPDFPTFSSPLYHNWAWTLLKNLSKANSPCQKNPSVGITKINIKGIGECWLCKTGRRSFTAVIRVLREGLIFCGSLNISLISSVQVVFLPKVLQSCLPLLLQAAGTSLQSQHSVFLFGMSPWIPGSACTSLEQQGRRFFLPGCCSAAGGWEIKTKVHLQAEIGCAVGWGNIQV